MYDYLSKMLMMEETLRKLKLMRLPIFCLQTNIAICAIIWWNCTSFKPLFELLQTGVYCCNDLVSV